MNILRPLSPHLPIYKPQLTSTFPISHRISGAFLATIVFFFDLLCLKIGLICFTYESVYQFFFYSSKLILFVLFFIAYLIVSIVWERYLIAEQLSLRFSIGTIKIFILFVYFLLFMLTKNVALCMEAPLEIQESNISQDAIWNELARREYLNAVQQNLRAHEAIGNHIIELRRQEGMRLPGGFQTERIVEMLEDRYGGEQMIAIERDIQLNGIRSRFYTETKTFYDDFRREGITEALLRKTWQGRG